MSRFDGDRLEDITAAIHAVRFHMLRGDVFDAVVLNAVGVRLIEIGEAAKALSAELTETEPADCQADRTKSLTLTLGQR